MRLFDVPTVRPVLAASINLLLIAIGFGAALLLPIREYPDVAPPNVNVSTIYPGGSAEIVETEVTKIIEDNLSGVEGLRLIRSISRSGSSSITVEFVAGTDIDAAAADVRDKVSAVRRNLPDDVEDPVIRKASADDRPMMWITLQSDKASPAELTDIASRRLTDALGAVSGVSSIIIGGEKRYAMRIWLDRKAMAARNVTPNDIADRLRQENVELPAGEIETPSQEILLRADTRLTSAQQFAALALRDEQADRVRIGDVAKVEVGVESYKGSFRVDGRQAIAIGVIRQSNANTLEVSDLVRQELERLRPTLPASIGIDVGFDESEYIQATLYNVFITLAQVIAIILFVLYLFLGTVRGTLVPAATIPASIIPVALIAAGLGFSVNVLTILAVILAISLCTDDAIVIMENIRRRQAEGEPLLLAAARTTRQIGFAVFVSALVLIAVILPLAFLQGNIGRLFQEFAVVLAAIVAISGFSALTLGPMLTAVLFTDDDQPGRLTQYVNRGVDWLGGHYRRLLTFATAHSWVPLLAGLAFAAAGVAAFAFVPSELAPDEDRGVVQIVIEGPEGASAEYMSEQVGRVERAALGLSGAGEDKTVLNVLSIVVPNFSGAQQPSNTAFVIVRLKPWEERTASQQEVIGSLQQVLAGITGVRAFAVAPPKLGQRGGSQPVRAAVAGVERSEVVEWVNDMMRQVRQIGGLINPDTDYKNTRPEIAVSIARDRAAAIGIDAQTIGTALQIMFGSLEVTRYTERGEEYEVILEANPSDRASKTDVNNIYVRAANDALVPLASVIQQAERSTVRELVRVNRLAAVTIEANLAPSLTLGDAITEIERIAAETLPQQAQLQYLGQSLDFQETGATIYAALGLAIIIVYLLLAGQFESFLLPLIVMTSAPVALAGGLVTILLFGFTLNIYSQIGMILLIGLVAKNAILVVEFANQLREDGRDPSEAVIEAAAQRLRPILMTSLATILGSIPLLLESGAGAESRVTVGAVTAGGVTLGTLLTLFVVPASYALLARFASPPGARQAELTRMEEAHARPQAQGE